ncbi:MAG: hypothetical protein ACR2P2_05980 [Nakamurella sp.]
MIGSRVSGCAALSGIDMALAAVVGVLALDTAGRAHIVRALTDSQLGVGVGT